jgi:hypothetical protein
MDFHFAENMDLWENGFMKTTLELPDALMHRVRLLALHRNQKLKDAISQLLELGVAAVEKRGRSARPPKPVRLKGVDRLDTYSIEAAISDGRD